MPNNKRNEYVVNRTLSPNDAQETEVLSTTSLTHARRTALQTARQHKGCRVAIDKYDWEGHYEGEVEAFYIIPASA